MSLALISLSSPTGYHAYPYLPNEKTARDYGIFNDSEGTSERASIIIDENGKIKWVKVYQRK
jgi:alkyl hydroperoxide reductase subunit AhpC